MPKKTVFTEEQINEIISLHNRGLLNREIAEIFNTSKSTIARRLQNARVKSRHPRLTEDREREAITLYEKYHLLNKVCEELSMNEHTLSTILKKHGIYQYTQAEIKRTRSIDETYFDKIDSHRKAYYLGLLYADGTVSKKSNRVQIALQEQDGYILYQLRDDLKSDYKISLLPYHDKNPNWSNQLCLTLTNTKIHDSLMGQGVVPNKSLILEFPDNLDEQYVNSFILGYMDGDGTITKTECRASLIGTVMFCEKVSEILLNKLGIHCSIGYCHKKKTTTRYLRISGRRQVKSFLDWIYSESDIYLKRKNDIYLEKYCLQ